MKDMLCPMKDMIQIFAMKDDYINNSLFTNWSWTSHCKLCV